VIEQSRPSTALGVLSRALLIATAAACLGASVVHLGILGIVADVGGGGRADLAAGIVEGAIGIAQTVAAAAVLARRPWARRAALVAYLFGIFGFLVGVIAVRRSVGLQTPFNVAVHAAVLPLLIVGLALAIAPEGARALLPAQESTARRR
jgi:hypothetical protein